MSNYTRKIRYDISVQHTDVNAAELPMTDAEICHFIDRMRAAERHIISYIIQLGLLWSMFAIAIAFTNIEPLTRGVIFGIAVLMFMLTCLLTMPMYPRHNRLDVRSAKLSCGNRGYTVRIIGEASPIYMGV